jgi:hypothetical protein
VHAHCGYTLLWCVQPLPLLSLPPPSHPPFSTAFSAHPCLLYLHIFMVCNISDALSFSFPFSFPKFHRVDPLLQTSEFVYDRACFCVYVYLWICLACMRENMPPLSVSSWLTSCNTMFSSCIYLPSNPMSLFLMAE